jgi:predicted Zn-dependent protease
MTTKTKTIGFKRGFREVSIDDSAMGSSFVRKALANSFLDLEKTKELFAPLPRPVSKEDWLAQYSESPQNFQGQFFFFDSTCTTAVVRVYTETDNTRFARGTILLRRRRPNDERRCVDWKELYHVPVNGRSICLLPIGTMDGIDLALMKEFLEAFFQGIPIVVEEPAQLTQNGDNDFSVAFDGWTFPLLSRSQSHKYTKYKYAESHRQFHVANFERLVSIAMKKHYCAVGITMLDLFMDNTDEFSMGAASMGGKRIGLFSFARYSPLFSRRAHVAEYQIANQFEQLPPDRMRELTTLRATKTCAHELLHMFGLDHCVYASCLMQGSGNLDEDFSIVHHLCPVCLHKVRMLFWMD